MTSSTPFYRKLILWSALALTVAAALLMEDEAEFSEEEVVLPTPRSANHKRADEQVRAILPIDRLGKRQFNAKADDIFAMTSWEPKRTPSIGSNENEQTFQTRQEQVKWTPPPPSAPPLPFEYLGRVISQGSVRIFLGLGDQVYVAGSGERINAEYRINRIREGTIELTYLPLSVRQILTIE